MPKDALTPQARHHFTRFDQVDQLVGASEADADLGFMARLMALWSLPRPNPGDALQYARCNCPYRSLRGRTFLGHYDHGMLWVYSA